MSIKTSNTPELLAGEINTAFEKFNVELSKSATKTEHNKLEKAVKVQGERLEQIWKGGGTPAGGGNSFKSLLKAQLQTGVFSDLADRKGSHAVIQIDTKQLSFLGTDQAGEAVQAWMPFDLPVYPYPEPVDSRLIFPTGESGSAKLEYPQEKAYTDGMAMLAENAASGSTAMTFEMVETDAKRMSTHIKVSRWALRNIDWLSNHISTRLMQFFVKLLNTQVLVGDGTGNNLSGVYHNAPVIAFTGTPFENSIPKGLGNNMDVLIQAKGYLYNLQNVMANTVFLNPADWSIMTSSKTTTADWVSGPAIVTLTKEGYTMVNGMILIPMKDIPAGAYMVGGISSSNIELLFNGPIEILATDSDQDDFTKNLVTIKLEAAILLPLYHAGAFAKGVFATDLPLIETA